MFGRNFEINLNYYRSYLDIMKKGWLNILLTFIIPSLVLAQSNPIQKTFLRYSDLEGTLVGLAPQIQVADIDDDLINEIMILVSDTLFILNEDTIQKFYAFDPLQTIKPDFWSLLHCTGQPSNKRLCSIGFYDIDLYWSEYDLANGNWAYGNLDYDQFQGLSTDPEGNIWMTVFEPFDPAPKILKMTNLQSTPITVAYIGEGDTSIQFNGGYLGYTPIFISANGQYISVIQTGDNIFTSGNPGGVYHFYSSDYGSTWQGDIIARGSLSDPVFGQVINRNLAPYFVQITSYSGGIDNSGILHFAIMGFGLTVENSDTTELSTILYWNNREKVWIAITDPRYEKDRDSEGNFLWQYFPGVALGQSLPSLSLSDDGSVILVSWTAPEFIGEPGASAYNIYPGDGGTYSTPIYFTDVLANVSFDGGITWEAENLFSLENQQNSSEGYLNLNQKLNLDRNINLKADYYYLIDVVPGWYGWLQNSQSDSNKWYYNSYSIILTHEMHDIAHLEEFKLEQNYPNPFNPNTKIIYQIKERTQVELKIFDILGREVETLVNEEKPAGSYEITWYAEQLPSGVYFYQLKAGEYINTKKMILLR